MPKVVENKKKKSTKKKKSAVNQKVTEFKRKWKNGPKHGCEEQNNDVVSIYETCTNAGMNCRESAQVKKKVAKFLGIQKVSLDARLKLHRKKKKVHSLTSSTSNLPFVLTPANSPEMSPPESNAVAQYFPALPLLDEDDIKREDTFQTISDDQQISNFDENPQLFQSTNMDDVAYQIKEEANNHDDSLEPADFMSEKAEI